MFNFFFSSRRRHTRLQGDWSSDVCSSDLSLSDIILKDLFFNPVFFTPMVLPLIIGLVVFIGFRVNRSEERRVGKECRSEWSSYNTKTKTCGVKENGGYGTEDKK